MPPLLAKVGHGFAGTSTGALTVATSVTKTGVEVFICVADAEPTAANANRPNSTIRGSWNFMSEDNL
jgi:hypothetical protein